MTSTRLGGERISWSGMTPEGSTALRPLRLTASWRRWRGRGGPFGPRPRCLLAPLFSSVPPHAPSPWRWVNSSMTPHRCTVETNSFLARLQSAQPRWCRSRSAEVICRVDPSPVSRSMWSKVNGARGCRGPTTPWSPADSNGRSKARTRVPEALFGLGRDEGRETGAMGRRPVSSCASKPLMVFTAICWPVGWECPLTSRRSWWRRR